MAKCEVIFEGQEYEGAESELGGLRDKILHAANMEVLEKPNSELWQNPTDIKILPVMTLDDPKFLVSAYHSTKSSDGMVGTFKSFDFSFSHTIEGENAYIRTDSEKAYPITSREMFLLVRLGDIASLNSINSVTAE